MVETDASTPRKADWPSLERFFKPSSVALVGASPDISKFGGWCLQQMRNFGYSGTIYPINPRYSEVQGLPCYPSLLETPGPIDHVGIVVPAGSVLEVLRQCEARGVPFATVFTSGFAEIGTPQGRALQQQITDFARRSGVRVMGPNCNGVINFVDGFSMAATASLDGPRRPAGNIGIVAHSGGVGQVNVMWRAQQMGLQISYEVSCGNDADLDALDFVRFMVEDPHTDVILVVAERFSSGARLATVARLAREREKPIVVFKLGRTEAGSRAAASHTGAVTGADAVYDVAFKQLGILRVDDFNELYETAMMLRTRRWPKGDGVAAMSISGGNVVVLTDLGSSLGIDYPEFTPRTQARLAELLPGYGTVRNPADVTTAGIGSGTLFQEVVNCIVADEQVHVVVPILTLAPRRFVDAVRSVADQTSKPIAILWTGACTDDPTVTPRTLIDAGVPVYQNTTPCLKAVRAAVDYGRFLRTTEAPPAGRGGAVGASFRPDSLDVDLEALRTRLRAANGPLAERPAKEILAAYGFPVTREALARTAADAARLATEIGFPVALKIESSEITHKTEAGAIRLGISSQDAAHRAFDEVMEAALAYRPTARIEGVLVQEMVPPGLEVILGLSRDPTFGPVVVAGLGGIHVEVLRDLAYRIPPIDHPEAHRMLRELRAYPLLQGVRGARPRDEDALADLLVRLSWLAVDLGDLVAELDINPLVVLERGAGARVVDALIVPAGTHGGSE